MLPFSPVQPNAAPASDLLNASFAKAAPPAPRLKARLRRPDDGLVEDPDRVEVMLRPANYSASHADGRIVNSAFLYGLRDSPHAHGLDSDVLFSIGRQAWRGIFGDLEKGTRGDFETTVAHPPGNPGEVQGFVTHSRDREGGPVIAYLYVAKAWRYYGIGEILLAHARVEKYVVFPVIFANPKRINLFRAKGYQPKFVPFLSWKWLV